MVRTRQRYGAIVSLPLPKTANPRIGVSNCHGYNWRDSC